MNDDLIGKRVYLLSPHPWAGEIGTVTELKTAAALGKTGLIVALDNGTDCFVFSEKNLKVV